MIHVKNYNNKQSEDMQISDFLNLFIQNRNNIKYEGRDYILQRNPNSTAQGGYFLVDPVTNKARLEQNQNQIWQLINYRPRNNNQTNNVISTSLLPSHK